MFTNSSVLNGVLRVRPCTCGIAIFLSLSLLFESLSREQMIDSNYKHSVCRFGSVGRGLRFGSVRRRVRQKAQQLGKYNLTYNTNIV